MAFTSLRQVRPGELMIIPREHIDEFCDVPDELASHMIVVANRLARAIRNLFTPKRMGLVVHGFGVPHAHLIVLPQHETTDIVSDRHAYVESGKIKYSEEHLPVWPRGQLDEVAAQIRKALDQLDLSDDIELEVQDHQLIVRATRHPRSTWAEQFKQMAAHGDDHLLDTDLVPTEWEESEWQW